MIRGLSNLHNRITDAKFSNVLFVFSHYCKESSRQIRRNPEPRLLQFKEVIEDYGLFPKPIFTSVIENKGKDNYLQMINGNYELPNMEYFPANLLNKFDTITKGGQDIIANAIINAAFRERENPKTFNMTETRFGLVSASHSKVAKYMSILSSATLSVGSTEVSRLLADSFETMPTQLKTQFPNALSYLQKYFNVRNFRSKNDLPQTTVAILELLEGINMKDEAVVYLLENGLKLTASTFPQKVVAGYSFNVLRDSVLPISPYKLDNNNLKMSPIGFRLPEAITCTKESNNFNLLQIVNTRDKYVRNRIESFGINMETVGSTELFTGLQRKIKEGFFVRDSSCSNNVCSFVASRYYKLFQFDLNTSAQLHPDFIKRVNNLTAFDESAYESINSWNAFFNDYGTHVVKSALGGGRIDIHVSHPTSISVDSLKNMLFKTVEFTEDPKLLITGDKIDPARVLPSGATYSLIFHGGSPTYHSSNLAAQSLEDAIKIMKNWKKSLSFHPAIYPIHYVPIHQQVAQSSSLGSQKSQIIQDATLRLFNSSLIYVAPTPDPKVLEEMARIKRENEEKLKQLAAEAKAKQEQAERERLAAIEEQKHRERDRQRREEQRRREEEELQKQLEKERQRMLKEQQEVLKRQEEEERKRQVQLTLQLLINRIQQEIRQQELQRQLDAARNRQRSSCLKQGTKILLADFTEKPVQELIIGDVLLDKDLKPTRVLGISYEFLLNQKFYGFDNQSFFFTDTHLFVGPKANVMKETLTPDQDLFQLYTTSKANLFAQNPLLKYLNVKDFDENTKFNDTLRTSLFHFDPLLHDKPVERDINVFLEPKIYPADTPIYFIQVDSPTGTYFAEGYVCRHEIPPLELWPNTIATLFSIFGTRGFKKLAQLPYSLETIYLIDGVSDNVRMRVKSVLDEEFLSGESAKHHEMNYYCKKQSLANFNLDEMIGKIFNNPTMAALAMELYGGTGSIMSKYMDNPNMPLSECQLQTLQDRIANVIGSQLEISNM
ncbi:Reticulocyte-binding protein 2 a, partial [Orchesella cincta]